MSAKQKLVSAARTVGMLPALEAARFVWFAARTYRANRRFVAAHPSFPAPPLWWMHDMYAHTSYARYQSTGRQHAAMLREVIRRHAPAGRLTIAEWGCGLARILRHMAGRFDRHGFDYNRTAIAWCRDNVPGVTFARNDLLPPLPAAAASFDVVYAVSVFTHLSERAHHQWIGEMGRVLKKGGLFIATFHGAEQAGNLPPPERAAFDAGELVVRGGVTEGGRTYATYHPEPFVRRMLAGFDILEGPVQALGQTLWVCRKR